jgi:hypothetical protein
MFTWFTWIIKRIIRNQIKGLLEKELILSKKRSKLVYKPLLHEIPKKLKKCSEIAKELKKINKEKEELNKKLESINH